MIFYTYMHSKKSDGIPFYIGKGKERRAYNTKGRSASWNKIVNENGIIVTIIAKWEREEDAFSHEKLLISCMNDIGIVLCNKISGGQGASGLKRSKESNAKISKNHKGKTEYTRKLISEKTKEAMKRPDVVLKLKMSQKNRKASDDTKLKMSISHKARLTIDEHNRLITMARSRTKESYDRARLLLIGKKREKVECPICGVKGSKNVMVRWHFNNCKKKP